MIDAASRRSQSAFVCVACGYAQNADVNAARVIGKRAELWLAGSSGALAPNADLRSALSSGWDPAHAAGRGVRVHTTKTVVGGTLRSTSLSASGPLAETMLRQLFADTAFISARGLSLERGLTEANPAESALKEIMIANSARVVALVDSSKFERTALSFFAPLTDVDVIVTDADADPRLLRALRERGLTFAWPLPWRPAGGRKQTRRLAANVRRRQHGKLDPVR